MPDWDDQIAFNVDSDAKQAAKNRLEFGELSEVLRNTVERVAFGEEVNEKEQVEARINLLREDRDDLRQERRRIEGEIEGIETELSRLEERMRRLEDSTQQYEAALEMLEENIIEGGRIWPAHPQVSRAAHIGNKDPRGVIDDLRERNPDLPELVFRQGIHDDNEWNGLKNA